MSIKLEPGDVEMCQVAAEAEHAQEQYTLMASNPNRGPPLPKPKYRVPMFWEKGEPLMVHRLSETCYRLQRSGSYLQLPGAPWRGQEYLEFRSRVEMVDFQEWWDNPTPDSPTNWRDKRGPHFWLTKAEFVEVLQEMFSLNLRDILGNRQGTEVVPAFTMAIQVDDENIQRALELAHMHYLAEVQRILGV